VTLVFFSASGSKLAPYILPIVPPLAVLAGVRVQDLAGFARRAARVGAALVVLVGAGLLLYSARRNSFVPHVALLWTVAGIAVAVMAVVATARRLRSAPEGAAPEAELGAAASDL